MSLSFPHRAGFIGSFALGQGRFRLTQLWNVRRGERIPLLQFPPQGEAPAQVLASLATMFFVSLGRRRTNQPHSNSDSREQAVLSRSCYPAAHAVAAACVASEEGRRPMGCSEKTRGRQQWRIERELFRFVLGKS